ncbi:tyrosine-protein phosphatase [Viscerimonas tarda]
MDKTLKSGLIGCIFSTLLFCNCSDNTSISFSCEKDRMNDYILKWEVFPEKNDAQIDIFCSDNDSLFPREPLVRKPLNDYVAIIESQDDAFRNFFKLKVGKTSSGIITNRRFEMDSVQNLRDLGGYFTSDNHQVRWGKIYRSGTLARITGNDNNTLQSLHIKTVIDFRDTSQVKNISDSYAAVNRINIPINACSFNPGIKRRIIEGSFLKGDAIIHTQDCYRDIIEHYPQQYSRFFDVLCDESNYPVLFHCELGKDRTGLAAYFLLKALDIPTDVVEEDFLLSNEGIDKFRMIKGEEELSEKTQEAMTMIFKADVSQLRYAIYCMKKKSGSVEEYMTKELNLTHRKKDKLKSILLYN